MSFRPLAVPCARPLPVLILVTSAVLNLPGQTDFTDVVDSLAPLDPFVVQGRGTDLVGTASSAAQGVVGAADLSARPFLRRGELLEVIPGMAVTQHSGGGKANQYFLRGFNLDHGTDFALSVDGMPVNLRSHAHGQGYADINFIIPEMVGQVDYSKGPYHAEVGDFSSAGAASFRLVDALPTSLARVEVGADHFTRAVVAGTSRTLGQSTTGAFEFTHDDGPWGLPENLNRFNGMLQRNWTGGRGHHQLTALAYHAEWRSTDQIPQRAVESGALDRFAAVDGTNGGASERASVSWETTLQGATGTTRLNAYAIYYRLNLYSNFTYRLDDPVNGDQFNQRDRRGVFGGELTHSWSTRLGVTTAGLQLRHDAVGEVALDRTARRNLIGTLRDDDVTETSAGVFARTHTRWNDWLRSEVGVRFDGYRFDVASNHPLNSGTRTAAIATPKLAVVLGPWAKTEIYLNAGEGFHSNDARGTTIRVDPISGEPVERVSPLVRSRGGEIGIRSAARYGWVSSVSLWALDLDSELVFVGDAGGTEETGASRRFGVEWANYYRITSSLTVDADLALTHARYRNAGDGTRIANSVSQVVTAGATWTSRTGWFGGARLRYFGPQPLIEDNSVRAPSSLTINARAGWRNASWEFAVDALNLLDRANNDIAHFYRSRLEGEAGDGSEDVHFHPAQPLTVRAQITRRF